MSDKEHDFPIPTETDVYWKKWIDAYNTDAITKEFKEIEDEAKRGHLEDLEYGDVEEQALFSSPIQTIITPFGVLPLTENALASTHFKFWVGHTNFKIGIDELSIIENCDGVETLEPLTPYRFKISPGQLFRDRDVLHTVRTSLLEFINGYQQEN